MRPYGKSERRRESVESHPRKHENGLPFILRPFVKLRTGRLRTNGYGLYRRLSDCSASAEPCLSWARRGVES